MPSLIRFAVKFLAALILAVSPLSPAASALAYPYNWLAPWDAHLVCNIGQGPSNKDYQDEDGDGGDLTKFHETGYKTWSNGIKTYNWGIDFSNCYDSTPETDKNGNLIYNYPHVEHNRLYAPTDAVIEEDGLVICASNCSADGLCCSPDWGTYVKMRTFDGYQLIMAHFRELDQALVRRYNAGYRVVPKGTYLGKLGESGKSWGTHLHLEISGHSSTETPVQTAINNNDNDAFLKAKASYDAQAHEDAKMLFQGQLQKYKDSGGTERIPGRIRNCHEIFGRISTEAKNKSFSCTDNLGIDFVYAPAGSFEMGLEPDQVGSGDEPKRHPVSVKDPFFISKYEVTKWD